MELIEIAQLVTGIATLVVASVLIWQMIIQKKTLDIAHNDADSTLSMTAISTRAFQNNWFAEICSPEMIEKIKIGLDALNDQEKRIVRTQFGNHFTILATEWRLGRLNKSKEYYKGNFIRAMQDNKATQDFFKQMYINRVGADKSRTDNIAVVDIELFNLGKEAWEDLNEEKLEYDAV